LRLVNMVIMCYAARSSPDGLRVEVFFFGTKVGTNGSRNKTTQILTTQQQEVGIEEFSPQITKQLKSYNLSIRFGWVGT